MTFGPAWQGLPPRNDAPDAEPANFALIRAAAERLAADLRLAELQTDHWQRLDLGQALIDDALDRCLAALIETGLWGRDNQIPSHELWRIAGPILECGGLQHRARFKPRGYAGDFEMLDDFWTRRENESLPGKLFDRYFLKQAAVEAVRARMEQAASAIMRPALEPEREELRVVSIGSGAATDLLQAAKLLPESACRKLRYSLVDIDEHALEFAKRRLDATLAPEQTTAHRENLFRLAKGRRGAALVADADVVLCTGLFDYLGDADAAAMLAMFWRGLRAGGTLLVGNFAPHCPTRAYMEWLGNWYLVYRTVEEFTLIADAAEIPAAQRRIGADRTGCDLFLVAEK
ncbi:MAG: class I SAM-dependent methyltransferase [Planctomycetia bacterium]|nr:class I SAM-dependent methyltransferase [Planctomycetia bacterium]